MVKTLVVFPVLPGKEETSRTGLPGYARDHHDEYVQSRQRLGLTLERVWDIATPMGELNILYAEGANDFATVSQMLAGSEMDFDKHFMATIKEISGIDFTQPPPGPPPEILGDWSDPDVSERRAGLAFCAPVLPGQSDAARAFLQEAFETRNAEHTASRRAFGISREVVCLNHTPMGDIAVVYLEGNDPVAGNKAFAESQTTYDRWFKDQLKPIVPPEIDFDQPVPPVQQIFEGSAAAVPTPS